VGPTGSVHVAKLLGDSVDQVIETYGHLMPENLADAVAMIDRKIGWDEVSATPPEPTAGRRCSPRKQPERTTVAEGIARERWLPHPGATRCSTRRGLCSCYGAAYDDSEP
jgi:hypothetical protein